MSRSGARRSLTFQERPSLRSRSTSLWQTAWTSKHCCRHSCSLCSMMWCHSLQVREALQRLSASSSLKILTLISVGSISAKFWEPSNGGGPCSFTENEHRRRPHRLILHNIPPGWRTWNNREDLNPNWRPSLSENCTRNNRIQFSEPGLMRKKDPTHTVLSGSSSVCQAAVSFIVACDLASWCSSLTTSCSNLDWVRVHTKSRL